MKQIIVAIIFLLGFLSPVVAQTFSVSDTVTEYSMRGTVYANIFEGRKTASGEVFRQNAYTAAHWRIKMGTLVMVSCPETGKQVIVKVNDRCPKHGLIDLTRKAASDLGIKGVKNVKVRILPDSYRSQWERQQSSVDYTPATQPSTAKSQPSKATQPGKPRPPKRDPDDDEDEPQF